MKSLSSLLALIFTVSLLTPLGYANTSTDALSNPKDAGDRAALTPAEVSAKEEAEAEHTEAKALRVALRRASGIPDLAIWSTDREKRKKKPGIAHTDPYVWSDASEDKQRHADASIRDIPRLQAVDGERPVDQRIDRPKATKLDQPVDQKVEPLKDTKIDQPVDQKVDGYAETKLDRPVDQKVPGLAEATVLPRKQIEEGSVLPYVKPETAVEAPKYIQPEDAIKAPTYIKPEAALEAPKYIQPEDAIKADWTIPPTMDYAQLRRGQLQPLRLSTAFGDIIPSAGLQHCIQENSGASSKECWYKMHVNKMNPANLISNSRGWTTITHSDGTSTVTKGSAYTGSSEADLIAFLEEEAKAGRVLVGFGVVVKRLTDANGNTHLAKQYVAITAEVKPGY